MSQSKATTYDGMVQELRQSHEKGELTDLGDMVLYQVPVDSSGGISLNPYGAPATLVFAGYHKGDGDTEEFISSMPPILSGRHRVGEIDLSNVLVDESFVAVFQDAEADTDHELTLDYPPEIR